MIQLQYTNPTTGHRPVLPIVKRDIPPGFSVSAKEYRPTMHPKCAAALADKDGKNLLMFKGRTEVTTRTSGRIYEKKEAAEMRSLIFLINIIHIKHNPPAIHLTGIHHIKCLMWNFCLISPWNHNAIFILSLTP